VVAVVGVKGWFFVLDFGDKPTATVGVRPLLVEIVVVVVIVVAVIFTGAPNFDIIESRATDVCETLTVVVGEGSVRSL